MDSRFRVGHHRRHPCHHTEWNVVVESDQALVEGPQMEHQPGDQVPNHRTQLSAHSATQTTDVWCRSGGSGLSRRPFVVTP